MKKILGSRNNRSSCSASHNTMLLIQKDEMEDIINIVKDYGLLKKGEFLNMLLGTLGASLLGNILAGWEINGAETSQGINRAGEGVIAKRQGRGILRTDYENKRGRKHNKMDF